MCAAVPSMLDCRVGMKLQCAVLLTILQIGKCPSFEILFSDFGPQFSEEQIGTCASVLRLKKRFTFIIREALDLKYLKKFPHVHKGFFLNLFNKCPSGPCALDFNF